MEASARDAVSPLTPDRFRRAGARADTGQLWVVRGVGTDALARHRSGGPDGLADLTRLCRVSKHRVIFENERVRVLEYMDVPGVSTHPHRQPDSVMYTLSPFRHWLLAGDRHHDVELPAGQVRWVAAQEHAGENIGVTDTYVIFVELKEPLPGGSCVTGPALGPCGGPEQRSVFLRRDGN